MAAPGHYKAIKSSSDRLEVKRAGKKHLCCGIAVERGERPGRLTDVWMMGRSRRCVAVIKANEYYVANRIVPPRVLASLVHYEAWLPTCLACALETYPECFTGPLCAQYLRPMTPERRKLVERGLVGILQDAREMAVSEERGDGEAA